jgi:hypothetical protein
MHSLLRFIRDHPILSPICGFLVWLGTVWPVFSGKALPQWLAEQRWPGISVEIKQWTSLILFIVLVCLPLYVAVMGRQREQRLEPDVWLYDAVHYVVFGSWEGPDKEMDGAEYFTSVMKAIEDIVQKAKDGALPIWGRQPFIGPGPVSRINPEYWEPSQLDVHGPHGFFKGNKEEFVTSSPGPITYHHLKTNKSQVERLWRRAGMARS